MFYPEYPDLEFTLRLVVSALLGAIIGVERELRAKEAGLRTHFMVALGSCLIMIVSQHSCGDLINEIGWGRFDPSRIAAQIVSGIGFLGAGIIIFRKEMVKGLTTAAGLWVVAGIGMAVGGGMYILGVAATVLTLIGFEVLRISSARFGLVTQVVHVNFVAKNSSSLNKTLSALRKIGCRPSNYSFRKETDNSLKVNMFVRFQTRSNDRESVISELEKLPGVKLEKFE